MKNNTKNIIMILAAMCLMSFLVACDTRPIPGDLITFYNSDLQKVKKLSPLETLYVELNGLGENKYYSVAVEDTLGNTVSKIEVSTDANGKIAITPLWYDTGLLKPDADFDYPRIDTSSELSLTAFKVRVKSLDDNETNFHQDLFFVTTDFTTASKPKPIVTAMYKDGDNYIMENAFEESGSLDANGEVSKKTLVYVDAQRIPWFYEGTEVTAVDIYVLPFDGDKLTADEDIVTGAIISRTDVAVVGDNDVTKKFATPELIWDLNGATTLINPMDSNCAYRVVIDVNQDGTFDYGTDVDADGTTDLYVDGIDGNSEPGFIVQNTPANEVFATIKNGRTADAAAANSIYEAEAALTEDLYLYIDNIPTSNNSVQIYVVAAVPSDGDTLDDGDDVRAGAGGDDFSTAVVTFPDSSDRRLMPYVQGAFLINTTRGDGYTYAANIAIDTQLSIVVDIASDGDYNEGTDLLLSATAVSTTGNQYKIDTGTFINVLAMPTTVETYAVATGGDLTSSFEETGSGNDKSVVWVDVTNENATVTLNLFPTKVWANGVSLTGEALMLSTQFAASADRFNFWDLDGIVQVKNPTILNGQYDIVVDIDEDGVYDAAGDVIVTVSIIDTDANDLPDVQYANIASSGVFAAGNYGYKDYFLDDCRNTYSSSYVTKGIKGIWNPYIKQYNTAAGDTTRTLYQGNYVDVYIVSTAVVNLKNWETIVLTDAIDATGRHKTLPVQYSCGNGAGQQNIWTPNLTIGSYYVIIDVNQNGQIDEGIDIIDAMNMHGVTIKDNAAMVGFTVSPSK